MNFIVSRHLGNFFLSTKRRLRYTWKAGGVMRRAGSRITPPPQSKSPLQRRPHRGQRRLPPRGFQVTLRTLPFLGATDRKSCEKLAPCPRSYLPDLCDFYLVFCFIRRNSGKWNSSLSQRLPASLQAHWGPEHQEMHDNITRNRPTRTLMFLTFTIKISSDSTKWR